MAEKDKREREMLMKTQWFKENETWLRTGHKHLAKAALCSVPFIVGTILLFLQYVDNGKWRNWQLAGGSVLVMFALFVGITQLIMYIDCRAMVDFPEWEEEPEEQEDDDGKSGAGVENGRRVLILKWKFKRHEWKDMLDAFIKHGWQFKKDTLQDAKCFKTENIGFSYSTTGALATIRDEFDRCGWLDHKRGRYYLSDVGEHAIRRQARDV